MKDTKLSLENNGYLTLNTYDFEEDLNDDLIVTNPINVGVCSSDIPRAFNNKSYFYPLVLGHEFSVLINEDKKGKFNYGQRCGVFPLIPCFKCSSCAEKKYNMCKNYSYYGSRTDGGLQSKINIKRWNLIPIPNNVDDISASLLEPISVCVNAVKKIKNNTKVLIYGGGFLAQIMSQLLLDKKCHIFCIDRNEYKKDYFQKNIFFTTKESDLEESSFDFVIECCGAKDIISKCIKYGKPEAKILQMANPSNNALLNADGISSLMRKEQQIIGTWNSKYRPDLKQKCDWHETISLLSSGKLFIKNLISHIVNIDDAPQLLKNIYHRKNSRSNISNFNKAIIKVNY